VRTLYFDCFAGVSGDMILGALVNAGVKLENLKSELAKLSLAGYSITAHKVMKNAISATRVEIQTDEQHVPRNLKDIVCIIDNSSLSHDIKQKSKSIFGRLASAEARIHDTDIDKIHFHEVGALDAIIDIVGAVIGIDKLGIDSICSSRVRLGRGFVECQHGTLPIPAPATLELLRGVPVVGTTLDAELTTPTGAAILTTLSDKFGAIPEMRCTKIAYGSGTADLRIPNVLRVLIGETVGDVGESEQIDVLETSVDNMNPEVFGFVIDKLLAEGALDAYMIPVYMKKNRPGVLLHVLVRSEKRDEMLATIFKETTTLGVRIHRVERRKLDRDIRSIHTRFGDVRVKIARLDGEICSISPEYEDCKRVAAGKHVALKHVYEEVQRAASNELGHE